jgi:hypothetical protein
MNLNKAINRKIWPTANFPVIATLCRLNEIKRNIDGHLHQMP